MNVETILRDKGRWVATIRPEATIEEAVETLSGSASALSSSARTATVEGRAVGARHRIALARNGDDCWSAPVDEVMTRDVITCEPSDSVGELMAEMTNRRIRHLPVVKDGRLWASSASATW